MGNGNINLFTGVDDKSQFLNFGQFRDTYIWFNDFVSKGKRVVVDVLKWQQRYKTFAIMYQNKIETNYNVEKMSCTSSIKRVVVCTKNKHHAPLRLNFLL